MKQQERKVRCCCTVKKLNKLVDGTMIHILVDICCPLHGYVIRSVSESP